MPTCFVKGCQSRNAKRKAGVSFHLIPKRMKVAWLNAIGRDPSTLVNQQRICSEHFNEWDFERSGSLKRVKANVLPSLNLPKKNGISPMLSPPRSPPRSPFIQSLKARPSQIQDKLRIIRNTRNALQNNRSSISSDNEEIIKFPKGGTFKEWVRNLRLSDQYEWSSNKFVCSRHFTETDVVRVGNKCRLLPDAIPTLEICTLNTTPTIAPQQIAQVETRLEMDEMKMTQFQCRTCLQISETQSSFSIEENIGERSIKSIILLFIPEMVISSLVDDKICDKCHQIVKTFIHFIERCIEVEGTLKKLNDGENECEDDWVSLSDSDTVSLPRDDAVIVHSDDEEEPSPQPIVVHDGPDRSDHSYYGKDLKLVNGYMGTPVTGGRAFTIPVFGSLRGITIKPHERVVSIPRPYDSKHMLSALGASGVKILEFDTAQGPPSGTDKKRILLLGNDVIRCHKCDAQFAKWPELKTHYGELHPDGPPLPDPGKVLFEHIIRKKQLSCHICKIECVSKGALHQHLAKEHDTYIPYKCERCDKSFRSKAIYERHVKELKNFDSCDYRKCRFCEEMIPNGSYFDHMKLHRKIVCEECGRCFLSISHLNVHKRRHASKRNEKHLCPTCGKLIANRTNIERHMRAHLELDAPGKHMCDKCPKIFLTSDRLYSHIRKVHNKTKVYECPVCKKTCSSSTTLKLHQKLKHEKTPSHTCHICGEHFARGDYFRRHVNRHVTSADGVFQRLRRYKKMVTPRCKYCDKVYRSVYALRQHIISSHLSSTRYKCKYCPFTFANLGNRLRHEKRHQDPDFELSCKICWKRMGTKEELAVHHQKHEMNKKYMCGMCGQSLSSRYHLLHHMTEKHFTEESMADRKAGLKEALEEFLVMK